MLILKLFWLPMPKNFILVVEDDPAYYTVLDGMIKRWGYETVWAKSGEEALEILRKHDSPQLAILDWMLPGLDGVEVCRILKERFADELKKFLGFHFEEGDKYHPKYVYTIILTAKSEPEDLVYALEKGADDYIVKPFNAPELQARIRMGFRVIGLYNQFISAQSKLKKLATCDYLTGVLNRMAILQRIQEEIYRCNRDGGVFSIILLDIDKFKKINDTYGHLVGDKVLIQFTKLVQSVLRKYDKLGRMGGEEFLVFLLNCDTNEAYKISERIRKILENSPINVEGMDLKVTASFGVSSWDPKIHKSLDDLLRAADEAVYEAKRKGGNTTILRQNP